MYDVKNAIFFIDRNITFCLIIRFKIFKYIDASLQNKIILLII